MTNKRKGTLSETLEAMLQQEAVYYSSATLNNTSQAAMAAVNSSVAALENIQELCRLRHRETLVIATSYLNRYLHSHTPCQEEELGRVALICLYMACKIHEPAALPMRTLTDLYQRFLAPDETNAPCLWEQLELEVCAALQWRLHPPMPMAFCDQFLTEAEEPRRLRRRVQTCLEAAFREHPAAFVHQHRASTLAMAALILVEEDDSCRSGNVFGQESQSCQLAKALAFLEDSRPIAVAPCSPLKSRKRCVTPTPSTGMDESHKRIKTSGIWTRSPQQVPPPCLLWTGSPRSALSMATE